jgi:hypothetical protein
MKKLTAYLIVCVASLAVIADIGGFTKDVDWQHAFGGHHIASPETRRDIGDIAIRMGNAIDRSDVRLRMTSFSGRR